VEVTAASTCPRRVIFLAYDDFAPWELFPLEEEARFESIMRPGHQSSGSFGANLTLRSENHIFGFEGREKDHRVVRQDEANHLFVHFVDKTSNPPLHFTPRAPHSITRFRPDPNSFAINARLQVVHMSADSINMTNIRLTKL